uniref:Microneme antigen n=1 Tax=Sarcocystis muris TaxID=5813 RepID=MIA1_SARMU|nr:RecName: Full=Microneme antigen; AltName: Full=Lectin SML3; Flags: Precursor [Sarcocystis muris]AAB18146.1 microneme antigen precursor [Sarcocystis muris]
MRLPIRFPKYVLYGMASAVWSILFLHILVGDTMSAADALSWSGGLIHSPAHRVNVMRSHHHEMGKELEQQHGAEEQQMQRDTKPAAFSNPPHLATGRGPSFVHADGQLDVSCFPHDKNIGSRTTEVAVVQVSSVQDCMKQCQSRPTCSHFTYNKNSKACHLKDGAPVFYTYNGDMTGPRSCDYSCTDNCWMNSETAVKALDYSGHGPGLCWAACKGTAGCIMYTFKGSTCTLYAKDSFNKS